MIRPKLIAATLLLVAVGPMTKPVSAITVELARKCEALTAKAFPPRVPGNPAAGSAKGSGKDERAYYKRCVDNDGKVDDGGGSASEKK